MHNRSWARLTLKVFGLYWLVNFFRYLGFLPQSAAAISSHMPTAYAYATLASIASQGLVLLTASIVFLVKTDRLISLVLTSDEPELPSPSIESSTLESTAVGVASLVLIVLSIGPVFALIYPFIQSLHSRPFSIRAIFFDYDQGRFTAALIQLVTAIALFFGRARIMRAYRAARGLERKGPEKHDEKEETA